MPIIPACTNQCLLLSSRHQFDLTSCHCGIDLPKVRPTAECAGYKVTYAKLTKLKGNGVFIPWNKKPGSDLEDPAAVK